MAGKLQKITQMQQIEIENLTRSSTKYTAFLTTAANNYKYAFHEQVLIHAQRPDATACAEIGLWNQLGRWVNKGAKGIALLVKTPERYMLRHVFDVSDTNSRQGREVSLWKLLPQYEQTVAEALENSYGTVENKTSFPRFLIDIATLIVEDNAEDYLTDLIDAAADAVAESPDIDRLRTQTKRLVANSVAYMLLSRCGFDPTTYLEESAFFRVIDYNTPKTAAIVGAAATDIAGMALTEIGVTVKNLQKEEKKQIRTFAKNEPGEYDKGAETTERSDTNGTELHAEGRLPVSGAGGTGSTEDRQVREAAGKLPDEAQERNLYGTSGDGRTEQPSGENGRASERDAGAADLEHGSETGRDGTDESGRSDEVGRDDEQYPGIGGGDRLEGTDLQVSDEPLTVEQQQKIIDEAEAEKASAFVISQEDIDSVLTRGSGIHEGKYRIFEQYLKKESAESNIAFLKNEYGVGGAYPAVGDRDLDESHDAKGIKISRGRIMQPNSEVLLKWNKVEKRIGELIDVGRYLSQKEVEHYPVYHAQEEARKARWKIAEEFASIIHDYNDYVEQIGEKDKALNLYYLSGCWGAFGIGEKKTNTRVAEGDFILPMMREAMNTIIADNTHLTERCKVMLEKLSGDIARPFEPTYNELNPPPEPKKEYRFSLGDTVYLGTQEYEILSFNDQEVVLFDTQFPIFNKALPREEFDNKLKENPLNDRLLQVVEETPAVDNTQAKISLDSGNDTVHWIYFNPDAAAGGQYVSGDLAFSVFEELIEQYDISDHPENTGAFRNDLEEMSDQFLADINTPFFMEAENDYEMDYDYLEFTPENLLKIHEDIQSFEADREARRETDRHEAEFGADGTGVFREVEKPYIDHYYVVEDLNAVPLDVKTFSERDKALSEYFSLPSNKVKAFGVQNTNNLPGSLDFIQCRNGIDTLTEDYLKVEESAGWQRDEIHALEGYLKEQIESHTVPLAPPPARAKTGKVAPHVLYPEIKAGDRNNFRIRNDHLGEGTPTERFYHNIHAIELLKKLEDERRLASSLEQDILSEYVGWGGLSDFFKEDNPHYAELKELLTEEEYESARASTLTAFYTPPTVIRAIYGALQDMGFRRGNILEPSCGIGNFFGMLPDSMHDSRLYGVELDSISGRIAQQLYQKSTVAIQGYEKTDLPDSFFDAAIGNIPFGSFKVPDKRYDRNNFLIHDYFFAKTLDKIRPGGIVAFVTSRGTMDKENPAVRKYIAQRADLLGAIRLPNNTFKSAAGTEVTADIIFLQKRDRLIDIEPEWVHLNTDEYGIKMNEYFVNNPEMILGDMQMVSGPHGEEAACIAYDGADLGEQLKEAIQNIHADYSEIDMEDLSEDDIDLSIPADPDVRNFSYTIVDGKVYYRENSRMAPVDAPVTALNRIKGMVEIRDCVRRLIAYQTEDYSEEEIKAEQEQLNRLYDTFCGKYGLINSRANNAAFNADSAYYLLSSLEVLDDEGNFIRKADMFSKRTIKQRVQVTAVDTASEALALSLSEKARVDMEYMQELTGKSAEQIELDLRGVVFLNPEYSLSSVGEQYVTADEYLSGNVREKLRTAKLVAETNPLLYTENVKALEAVQPKDLSASEISIRLGATWIPPEIVEQFMYELLSTPRYAQWSIHVRYAQYTGEWNVEGKTYDRGNVKANLTYGTSRANAYRIIEDTLNLKDVRIFDYIEDANGKKTPVLNKKETAFAQGKQELIKTAFADWIWEDPERRERLCKIYNEKFNSIRPREYNGSHLTFAGINPEIRLRQHQVNAVAHIMYGGNTLLAHVVGAGKSATRS